MCLFVICASAAGAAPTTDPVAEARAALDRAVSVRRDAETRSDQVHQQLAEHEANLARQVGADTDAAHRMEQARAQMQRSATAALIGDDDVATAMDWLSPGPAMERSARAVYPAHRAEQFADATAVYRAARARLAPELRKLADEIAQLRPRMPKPTPPPSKRRPSNGTPSAIWTRPRKRRAPKPRQTERRPPATPRSERRHGE